MIKTRLLLAIALSLLAHTAAHAQSPNCQDPQSQNDMSQCAARSFETADAELNRLYKAVMSKLDAKAMASTKAKLLQSQKSWIQYKETYCDAFVDPLGDGSMTPQIRSGCLAEITKNRVKELKEFSEQF